MIYLFCLFMVSFLMMCVDQVGVKLMNGCYLNYTFPVSHDDCIK
jgi:hypothetical protein